MPETTWATSEDLYKRYGDEFVDRLAIRRRWNDTLQDYVADESPEGKAEVIELALSDAEQLIKRKIACHYTNSEILDDNLFESILQWHIRLTIETLQIGGNCMGCACIPDLDSYLGCGKICSDAGVCLTSSKTFISASVAVFECECQSKGCRCSC